MKRIKISLLSLLIVLTACQSVGEKIDEKIRNNKFATSVVYDEEEKRYQIFVQGHKDSNFRGEVSKKGEVLSITLSNPHKEYGQWIPYCIYESGDYCYGEEISVEGKKEGIEMAKLLIPLYKEINKKLNMDTEDWKEYIKYLYEKEVSK